MKRSILLLIFGLFCYSCFAQKNWEALEVGGPGAKYRVTQYSYGVHQKGRPKKDTTIEKKIVEFTRRFVDSDNESLFAELEINIIDNLIPINQYSKKKEYPEHSIHFKLNKQGGNPQLWNNKRRMQSVAWSFFDIPNKKLKKGNSWKANFLVPINNETITLSLKVVGKIDTLGHECSIITASGDFLDKVLVTMKIPKEMTEGDQFEGIGEIDYRFYVDKNSGLLVYGQSKINSLISFKDPQIPFFFEGFASETISLLSTDIPGLKKTINKFSPEERAEQELNAERNLPPVEYDFDEKLKVIFPMKFHEDFISRNFYRGYSSVKIDNQWRLVDSTGYLVPDFFSAEEIHHINDYFTFSPEEGSGVGLKRIDGNEFWKPKYESIWEPKPGAFFVTNGTQSTFVNKKGEEILPSDNYDRHLIFGNNCAFTAVTYKGKRTGTYYDQNVSLPLGYNITHTKEHDIIWAKKDSKMYLFNCSGNLLFEKPVESFAYLDKQFFKVKFSESEIITVYEIKNGKPVEKISLPNIDFGGYKNNAAFYSFSKDGKKTGLFDKQFNVVLNPGNYEEMDCNADGCFFKYPNGSYGSYTPEKGIVQLNSNDSLYIDRGLPFIFNSEKMIPCSIYGTPIFKNEEGIVYQPMVDFESYTWISDLFIKKKVDSDGNQVLVNAAGETLTSRSYSLINYSTTKEEYIVVQNEEEKVGLIHISGKEIISPQFDKIKGSRFDNDYRFEVKKDGKYGVINIKGELLLPTDFDSITLNKHGMIWVKKDNKYGLVKSIE